MPRDGSNIYSIPLGTEGIPDTTIESDRYNTFVHDVEADLNAPRPIVAGGTGANDADEALVNLKAEKAGQVVTNYDSHPWVAGSFYSATTATNPPVASHAFAGIVYSNGTDYVVEATDLTDAAHKKYLRAKVGGTWTSWTDETGDKVNRAGDTMTGHLGLPVGPAADQATRKDYVDAQDALKVSKAGDTMLGQLNLVGGGSWAWFNPSGAGSYFDTKLTANAFFLGTDSANESFRLYSPASGQCFEVDKATGLMVVKGGPTAPFGVATKGYVDALVDRASGAEFIANTAPNKLLTPGAVWAAAAYGSIPDVATLTPNMGQASDFFLPLTGSSYTLGAPLNAKVGQKGIIYLQQASANRTITSWHTYWKFSGGIKPTLSTGAGAVDAISYAVLDPTFIACTFVPNLV